jgi:hypothetical protein
LHSHEEEEEQVLSSTEERNHEPDWHNNSEGGDPEEDLLAEMEFNRLVASNGNAGPMWAKMPEFAGCTNATRAYQLRSHSNKKN